MNLNITQYHQQLLDGSLTCEATVDYFLNNIRLHESLNAFVEIYEDEAKAIALDLDQRRKSGLPIGKMHGVVIAIKDVICYKDHKVTASSKMLTGFKSLFNATVIQHLLDEEAIIIGNCNCDEFAMGSSNEHSYYGPVKNAADPTRVPGGSSGGSAVAVQANMCMIALGSDTGGSVRQPADFCGVMGLKPGYGSLSRYGLIAYASSFDQIGIFAKHTEDLIVAMEVMGKSDKRDGTMNQQQDYTNWKTEIAGLQSKKFRIGIFPNILNHPSLDQEISSNIQNLIAELKNEGHDITAQSFDLIDYIVPAYYVLTTAEASSNLSRYDGIRYGHRSIEQASDLADFYKKNRTEGFGSEVKRRIMLGNFVLSSGYYDAYFGKAQKVRRLLTEQIDRIFQQCDVLIMPVSPSTAFKLGEKEKDPVSMYLADIFTVLANLTGIPAMAFPFFKHSNGLPYGIQILAGKNKETQMLAFAKMMEEKR